ncbi:MAG TPA: MBL fold metallo-hydrolase [Anaerolineae bacterium]|nr:MBL fold metallo-hydrolase [Anaerolineae bacterium]
MNGEVIYRQINKDYAYWIEKRRIGQPKGGQVAGLLTHRVEGRVKQNILFDAGLGTIEGLADCCDDAFWDEPLVIFITHGHIDHHAELMILSEIYCQRRGRHIHDIRPAVPVFCTAETQRHLYNTHRYGYTDGATLQPKLIKPEIPLPVGIFNINPLPVDHFAGAVIYVIAFELEKQHKIIIGWDTTTLPLTPQHLEYLRCPSLALLETTTWTSMAEEIGHSGIEDLVKTGFLEQLQLHFQPEQERYGAYLVHYSGWEDPWGMLTDQQLKTKFDETFPKFSPVVRVAERGQGWYFT